MRFAWLAVMLAACGSNHGTPPTDAPGTTSDAGADGGVDSGGGSAIASADPTFGTDGLATANLDGAMDGLMRIARQPDGKYVAVGGTQEAVLVLRFGSDGTLDPTFGTAGSLQLPWGLSGPGVRMSRYGVALQSDGKIVIAAELDGRYGGYTGGVVARITTDGALDTSFAGTGVAVAPSDPGWFTGVAVQSDGKIVAGGNVLARYNTDGSLDPSFGSGGWVAATPYIIDLALASDGTIIAITSAAIARYTAAGALDATFGSAGSASVPAFGASDSLYDLALQGDGKIVVAGGLTATSGGVENFTLARYTTAGIPDAAFGSTGFVRDGGSAGTYAYGLGIQSDGKIVATGRAQFSATVSSLVRVGSDGTLDAAFGSDGQTDTCGSYSNVVFDPDGSITSTAQTIGIPTMWAICKVSPDGAGFAKYGSTGGSYDSATAVAFQPDGKLVVGGQSLDNGPALVRFGSDGSIDTSFGSAGIVLPDNSILFQVNSVIAQPTGGIVVTGIPQTGYRDSLIALRYTSTGAIDTSFGSNGLASATAGLGDETLAMAGTPDGKIIVAGSTNIGTEFAVARFTAAGAPDATFGSNGTATSSFASGANQAELVAVAPDGSIIALGSTSHPADFALVKFTTAGAVDSTFGSDGVAPLPASGLSEPLALALQSDGSALALFGQIDGRFDLVRVLPNGTLDSAFGTAGVVTVGLGGNDYSNERAGLVQLADGKIMLGLASSANDLVESAVLVRLTAAGSLDATFGTNGVQTLALSLGSSAIHSLALDGTGKLVAVGRAWTDAGDSDFAVLRFLQ